MTFVDLDQPFSIWWILRSPPWLGWPLWNICVTNDHEYVTLVVSTSRSFPHSWFITGFITRLARRMSLVEQELLTLPDHLSSPPVFSEVRVTRCLVLCVCFVDRCLSFCTFSFGHCVVCSSSIYGFWLPLWYLQTLLERPCTDSSLHANIILLVSLCWIYRLNKTIISFPKNSSFWNCNTESKTNERFCLQNKKKYHSPIQHWLNNTKSVYTTPVIII